MIQIMPHRRQWHPQERLTVTELMLTLQTLTHQLLSELTGTVTRLLDIARGMGNGREEEGSGSESEARRRARVTR